MRVLMNFLDLVGRKCYEQYDERFSNFLFAFGIEWCVGSTKLVFGSMSWMETFSLLFE
jgi:hypothetical protein